VHLQLEYPANWDYSQPIKRDSEYSAHCHLYGFCTYARRVCACSCSRVHALVGSWLFETASTYLGPTRKSPAHPARQ
jgi:hypothetical protein